MTLHSECYDCIISLFKLNSKIQKKLHGVFMTKLIFYSCYITYLTSVSPWKIFFSSSKQNISSLLLWDAPPNEIASITDVRRSNTYEYKRTLKLYSKNLQGAQLSELSPADQRKILGEITTARVDYEVQAT